MTSAPQILDQFARPLPARRSPSAYYEGAQSSTLRSVLPTVIQEVRKDLSRSTRRQLLKNSRHLFKNNPLLKAVVERLVIYTVGTGILPEPDSSDVSWNKRAGEFIREWAKSPDVSSKISLGKMQEIALRSALVDGDVFILKTFSTGGRAKAQLVEADRIGSLYGVIQYPNDDGVTCDTNGLPLSYTLQPATAGGKERKIPAAAVVPLANIERPGQCRGVCMAAAALTTAIDLHDILGLEKVAVKSGSAQIDTIKTQSGEINAEDVARGVAPADADPAEVVRYYRQVFGPESRVLRPGDDITPYVSGRPSPAWQGFVDFLAELVCLAFNLPPSMVRQLKVGGADTRRDLATMQRVAEVWQASVVQAWQEIYEYVIEAEILDGSLAGAPADWRKAEWQFPRAPTVDAGRTSQQDREDIRTGNMTLQEGCGQYGQDWRRHLRQLAREMQTVSEMEREFMLPPGSLARRIYGDDGKDAVMRSQLDAYGVAVRAGSITPNIDDERVLRAKMGLPAPSKDVERVWNEDGGARKPVTLQSQETQNTANDAAAAQ